MADKNWICKECEHIFLPISSNNRGVYSCPRCGSTGTIPEYMYIKKEENKMDLSQRREELSQYFNTKKKKEKPLNVTIKWLDPKYEKYEPQVKKEIKIIENLILEYINDLKSGLIKRDITLSIDIEESNVIDEDIYMEINKNRIWLCSKNNDNKIGIITVTNPEYSKKTYAKLLNHYEKKLNLSDLAYIRRKKYRSLYIFLLLFWVVIFFISPYDRKRETFPVIIGYILLISLFYLVVIVKGDVLRRDVPPTFGSEEESEE